MTGLRSDELCWLTKEDVYLEPKPHLRICRKSVAGRRWQAKRGKERIVPLVPPAVEIAQRASRMSNGPWLFWSPLSRAPHRGQFHPSSIVAALHRAKRAAGVERGVTHTFRHVFCSFAANRRISPFKVMKILGHGSLEIVLIYYHVERDELLDCLNDLHFDEFVKSGDEPSGRWN